MALTLDGTTGISASGNIIGNNITVGGTLTVGSFSVSSLSVPGNIAGGNITTVGLISATGNITDGNILCGANVNATTHTGTTVSVTGNITAGNLNAAGLSLSSNVVSALVSAANITTSANISGGNVLGTFLGNLNGTTVSASGNITAGNINSNNIIGTELTATSTGNLLLSATGNIVVNTYINNLNDPVQDQDAATKYYVDTVASGLHIHAPANVATLSDLQSTFAGSTVTYTQPNGAGNGVGATLTITGNTFSALDGVSLTSAMRILVKDQSNAVTNGIYVYSNSTAFTRSSDADLSSDLSGGDFVFVQSGDTQADTGWVMTSDQPVMGVGNIIWNQFSGVGTYSANTQAGLELDFQTFNAKVDNITTAFDGGGNISVKVSANLTTPNIGAATGTSLSVDNNVAANEFSALGNITGSYYTGNGRQLTGIVSGSNSEIQFNNLGYLDGSANLTFDSAWNNGAGLLNVGYSANGEFTAGSISANSSITTPGLISATGNVTAGNINAAGLSLSSNVISNLNVTPNIAGGNITTPGLISATGNITGGNLNAAGLSLSSNVVSDLNVTANITSGNITTGGLTSTTNFGITGNIIGNLVPSANITYNLGTATQRWNTLYLAGNTIDLGAQTISANATSVSIGSGDLAAGNIATPGFVSATGNVDAGNLNAAGLSLSSNVVSNLNVTANITSGNISTPGVISAGGLSLSGNVLSALNSTSNITTTGNISAGTFVGNINGATISVTGNITGGNINTTGNITGGNAIIGNAGGYGDVTTTQFAGIFAKANGLNATSLMQVKGNDGINGMGMRAVTGSNGLIYSNSAIDLRVGSTIRDLDTPSAGTTIATIASTGLTVTGIVSASGNITGGNIIASANISAASVSASGNVTANYFIGNVVGNIAGNVTAPGSTTQVIYNLDGILNASTGLIFDNTANILTVGGQVGNLVTGNSYNYGLSQIIGNLMAGNVNTGGLISATGNITGGNLQAAGLSLSGNVVSALNMTTNITTTGNITGGNILTSGIMSSIGNAFHGNLSVSGTINIGPALAATIDDVIALSIALG